MSKRPQDTPAEEPDGGNPHIRFRGGPELGNRLGLLNTARSIMSAVGIKNSRTRSIHASGREIIMWPRRRSSICSA